MFYDYLESPIGRLLLLADDHGLCGVGFETSRRALQPDPAWQREPAALRIAATQLREYFAGARETFDLPLHPVGTPFQCQVWQLLGEVPYAQTISYGELARRLGTPSASRAVGAANGRNPLPIIVPCHRVIGADGSLTGFGGGIETKRRLLALEQDRRGLFA